jgi:hypothetical protein
VPEPRVDHVEKKPAQITADSLVDGAEVSAVKNITAEISTLGMVHIV